MVLAATMMVVVMAASPAWADTGNHTGGGIGGGDTAHTDQGNHTATGGGRDNSPHLGCGITCG